MGGGMTGSVMLRHSSEFPLSFQHFPWQKNTATFDNLNIKKSGRMFFCVQMFFAVFVSGCFNGVVRMESSGIKTFLPNNKFGGNIKKVGQK